MKYLYILIVLFSSSTISAQPSPVKWSLDISTLNNGNHKLTFTATIDNGWYLYSQSIGEGGPKPTTFTFSGLDPIGETKEVTEAEISYSELFEMEVAKFSKSAIFEQEFTPKQGAKSGQIVINFMSCDNEKCLPPTDKIFDIKL